MLDFEVRLTMIDKCPRMEILELFGHLQKIEKKKNCDDRNTEKNWHDMSRQTEDPWKNCIKANVFCKAMHDMILTGIDT